MKVCYVKASKSGSGYYRVELPARYLSKFHPVTVIDRLTAPALEVHDLFIVQYVMNKEYADLITKWREKGKVFVFELDDNLWNIMEGNKAKGFWTRERLDAVERIMSACNAVTVSTKPLADYAAKYNPHVHVIANYIVPPAGPVPQRETGEIRIGYCASLSHIPDMSDELMRALLDLKKKYAYRIELIFIDWIKSPLAGKVAIFPGTEAKDYLNFLYSLDLDIGLIPCECTVFNESRSNLKYLEYSILKAVTIASPIYPYVHTIPEGAGFVMPDNSARTWTDALSLLIEDDALRKETAGRACLHVKDNYLLETNIASIAQYYESLWAASRKGGVTGNRE